MDPEAKEESSVIKSNFVFFGFFSTILYPFGHFGVGQVFSKAIDYLSIITLTVFI